MISIKGKLDLESPSAALCIRLAMTELDFTIFYVIARLTAPVQPKPILVVLEALDKYGGPDEQSQL